MQACLLPAWDISPTEHCSIVNQHMFTGMVQCFKHDAATSHGELSDVTASVLHLLRVHRRGFRQALDLLAQSWLRAIMAVWQRAASSPPWASALLSSSPAVSSGRYLQTLLLAWRYLVHRGFSDGIPDRAPNACSDIGRVLQQALAVTKSLLGVSLHCGSTVRLGRKRV